MRPREVEILKVPREKIVEIEFRVLSPEMIKKMAVAKITKPDLYDVDGYPVEGGILDPRLGVADPGLRCKTCGGKLDTCPGHWGYLELARPVFHIKFIKHIVNILKAICLECGRVTLPDDVKEKYRQRAKEAYEKYGEDAMWNVYKEAFEAARREKKCPYCGKEKPKIEFQKPYYIYVNGERVWPDKVREWLEKIPNDDVWFLEMNPEACRPEWLVLTVLPIPPVSVRPSITLESGLKAEDDLTHKLADIVRTNQKLEEHINSGAPLTIIESYWELLQYHVATYFDNDPTLGYPPARHRSGKVLKTLAQRIEGKEGRIRHNLAGKRVNFSARGVIIPDPWIYPDEVGVPLQVAKTITYPVRVTYWNKEEVIKYILNGPEKYPGANYVISPDGRRRRILDTNKEVIKDLIEEGWIVERHLIDGDYVLFHRYPSLHRMNIMAHRVRVLSGRVFRINPASTVPYNADFDGDEMNLHVPQTEEAQAELRYLMEVKYHVVTPRYGLPIIGQKQDFIMGMFLLTYGEVLLSKEDVMYFLGFAGIEVDKLPEPAKIIDGKPYWTGKQIFSLLLPKINYEGKSTLGKSYPNDPEAKVVIKDGVLIRGAIDKASLGAEDGKLLRKIYEVYGPDKTIEFLHRANLLALAALHKWGVTIHLDDFTVSPEISIKKKEIIKRALEEVRRLIEAYEKGELPLIPGKTLKETLMEKISEVLNKIRTDMTDLVTSYVDLKKNNVAKIAASGARGKILNLVLILTSLGQQTIRGEPISRGFRRRVLSHFKLGEKDPKTVTKSLGFVLSSYKDGLDPIEFFMHVAAARSNLMERVLGTQKSGYFYRRMVNAMYDVKVEYDYTVRDARGVIIQFLYGEDGLDVTKTFHGEFDIDFIVDIALEKIRRRKEKEQK